MTEETVQGAARPLPTGPFWIAVGIACGWIALLALLAWRYSNPVTLNIEQILSSDRVLIGRVVPSSEDSAAKSGSHLVIEPVQDVPESKSEWPVEDGQPVTISNLDETPARPSRAYLFPVIEDPEQSGSFQVLSADLVDGSLLIYPLSDESIHQLQAIKGLRSGQVVPRPKRQAIPD